MPTTLPRIAPPESVRRTRRSRPRNHMCSGSVAAPMILPAPADVQRNRRVAAILRRRSTLIGRRRFRITVSTNRPHRRGGAQATPTRVSLVGSGGRPAAPGVGDAATPRPVRRRQGRRAIPPRCGRPGLVEFGPRNGPLRSRGPWPAPQRRSSSRCRRSGRGHPQRPAAFGRRMHVGSTTLRRHRQVRQAACADRARMPPHRPGWQRSRTLLLSLLLPDSARSPPAGLRAPRPDHGSGGDRTRVRAAVGR